MVNSNFSGTSDIKKMKQNILYESNFQDNATAFNLNY